MNDLKRFIVAIVALALIVGLLGVEPAAALGRDVRLQILKSVVQLGPVAEVTNKGKTELRAMGWGSGTIISADGLILTNYHVVDVSDFDAPSNVKVLEGMVAVYITTKSDKPPTLSYIAEVVAASPELDLAVVRITRKISGETVSASKLKLPYVKLGDSDELETGDSIYIFGYPGIGGETLTFTSGVVSGFTSEKGVGNRAWIKTDAAISGGNSGGTGVNDDGLLIGVPTQVGRGGVGGESEYVDCRVLADTNGNGKLDKGDACVPVGGFINALRPAKLAQPLITQAQKGKTTPTTPVSPGKTTQEGVQIYGVIKDVDSGKPIPNALFIVLQPGVTYDAWENDDQVYSMAKADTKGKFTLPDLLERGQTYTLVVGLKGYVPIHEDDVLVEKDADAEIELTITLQKQR